MKAIPYAWAFWSWKIKSSSCVISIWGMWNLKLMFFGIVLMQKGYRTTGIFLCSLESLIRESHLSQIFVVKLLIVSLLSNEIGLLFVVWKVWNHRNAVLHGDAQISDARLLDSLLSLHVDFIDANQ